jgi:hypothetical protein
MSLFHRKVQFSKVDPLANGLDEEIAAEQHEAEAIRSFDDTSADELVRFWSGVVKDIKKDPDWFDFSEE